MDFLQNHIESLIFCSKDPITKDEIQQCLTEMFEAHIPETDVANAINNLIKKFESENYAFQVYHTGGGYQFLSKPAYQTSISILLKQRSKKRLSNSSLETLALIAYKQPVTKNKVEEIRGVNCDYVIQKLLDKELIEIRGKSDSIGRPLIYATSKKFMDFFGLNTLDDLPVPKDFSNE